MSTLPTHHNPYDGRDGDLDAAPAVSATGVLSSSALALDGHLSVRRGHAEVVRDVRVSVATGTATGVVGRNGAGKSTLLSGVCGLLPLTGSLTFEGTSLAGTSAQERARRGIALVPQGRRLISELSVKDNLRAAHLAPGGEGPHLDVDALFPAVREFSDRRAGMLSGGQQQQVAIVRALLRRPRLLILDEPTEGLAPAVIDTLVESLQRAVEAGLSVLVAEQRLDVLERLCRTVIVLRSGVAVAYGHPASPDVLGQATAL